MHLRARDESGFGMLELLMAMVMLNVGILAIVGAFSSGSAALARANRISTASALSNVQMEVFRGLRYDKIAFASGEWSSALADSVYTADTVYQQNMQSPTPPKALVPAVTSCPSTVPVNACDPSYATNGPDQRPYRVDTYLYYDTPTSGSQLKVVTVVVRDGNDVSRVYARVSSTFDSSTNG